PTNSIFYLSNQVCNCTVASDYAPLFGNPYNVPFTGDWNGDGLTGIGVFQADNGSMSLRNNPQVIGSADLSLVYGVANDAPLAGRWSDAGLAGVVSVPSVELEIAPTFVPKN
ncbi:MAG: hypothetical protein KF726_16445, partial [Anaerolineae bacterium]|nr:hypothetical protein [Anaerolineae bacterium]